MSKKGHPPNQKNIAVNRKALRDYVVLEKYEAGIVLWGNEVKAFREGRISFKDSYASFHKDELWLYNLHVSAPPRDGWTDYEPERPRKLLLHKRELKKLYGAVMQKGVTLIPLRFYFKGPYVKVELGLCRGRKEYDKRQRFLKREAEREMARAVKYAQNYKKN